MGLRKYFVKNKAGESIEAEEIFLDAEAIRSLEDKGKLEQPIKQRNFFVFYFLIIVCLAGLLVRAGYLQVVKGDYYLSLAEGNRLRIYSLPAPRGIIYDRFQQPLVYNVPSFDLMVNLVDFSDNPLLIQDKILEEIVAVVSNQTATSSVLFEKKWTSRNEKMINELKQKIAQARNQTRTSQLVLIKNIDRSNALILETMVNDWPGIRLEKNARRQYLLGLYFAHVLGYTGQVSQKDLEKEPNYSLNDQIGKAGLEEQYDQILRGETGQEQQEVDVLGKSKGLIAVKPAQPGNGLILSLDRDLQEKLYQSLNNMLSQLSVSGKRIKRAAAVAMDPSNGSILALVSLPSFDNNLFSQGISQTDLNSLENDPNQPFLNRVLAGQYPSGSTIKPLLGAAALEEKIISPSQKIDCSGNISIVNKYNPEIVYNYPDWKAHGLTDIIKAIAESCNVYFYTVGGGYGQIEGLGIGRIKKYLQDFGWGQTTQIDLPHEEIGLVPDQEWKKKQAGQWTLGDTYHLAIGQGDIMVTPLQLTVAIAAIANNGTLYQPQIVDKIVDINKNIIEDIPAKIIRNNFIQLKNLKTIQQGMRQAVTEGSAIALSTLPFKVAGKTGTAQFGSGKETHAWFTGYAPFQDPKIVITVLVEGGGEGHQTALPVAKEVLEWYFNH